MSSDSSNDTRYIPIEEIAVVNNDGKMSLMTRSELAESSEEVRGLRSLKEVLADEAITPDLIQMLRDDINDLLDRVDMKASQEIVDFLEGAIALEEAKAMSEEETIIDEDLSDDPLQRVLVIKINGKMVTMTREEVEAYSQKLEVLGTLKEVLVDASDTDIEQLRKDTEAMLARVDQSPSTEVMKLLQANSDPRDETVNSEEARIAKPKVITYTSSKHSPLPVQSDKTVLNMSAGPSGSYEYDPINNKRTLLESETREPGVYQLCLFDWDETLNEAQSKHSIMLHDFAKFLIEKRAKDFVEKGGSLQYLKSLIRYCDKWEIQRQRVFEKVPIEDIRKELGMDGKENLIEYEVGIKQSGTYSALAFTGMDIKVLEEYGKEFMNGDSSGKLFDYAPEVIQLARDYGAEPVIVTGAPDFLLPAILEKSGVRFGKGMTYDTKKDDNGNEIITREIKKHKGNMGLAEMKDDYAKELTRKHYGIIGGMGNSVGDIGIVSSAVNKDRAKEDMNGGAVLTNVSKTAKAIIKLFYSRHLKDERVIMVDTEEYDTPEKHAKAVVNGFRTVLEKVLEPSAQFIEGKGNPAKMEKLMKGLKERKARGKKHPNIENIKRLRDALKDHGLNQDEITVALLAFFPDIIVDGVMKGYMLNLRDKSDMKTWLGKLQKFGLTKEEASTVLIANTMLQASSSVPPEAGESSEEKTEPPSSDKTDDATQQIITQKEGKEVGETYTIEVKDCRGSEFPPKDS